MKESLANLKKNVREIYLLEHAQATVSWDQETKMPDEANTERADQAALLEGIIHQKITSPEIGRLLSALGAEDSKPEGKGDFCIEDKAFVREVFRSYNRATKLPKALVSEIAKQTGLAHNTWVNAKKSSDFSIFEDNLEKIVELNREKAEKLGYKEAPYDALLDEYEPGMTTNQLKQLFAPLSENLTKLTKKIQKSKQIDSSFLEKVYPVEKQDQLGRKILTLLGFPFNRGRLDVSAHPFTTTLGENDVRITSRYEEKNVLSGLFSTIHECGHALYELGMGEEIKGNILATGVSLGIHESQSRFWENIIGRSRSFCQLIYPDFQREFPEQTKNTSVDSFFKAVNRVNPSFIRTEADEVTYSLHVILRFELEKALLDGSLKVSSLPDEWNKMMKKFLNVVPPNDALGVLQDVHWSAGLIGYFPTYVLGNLYSAQFYDAMKRDIPNINEIIEAGELTAILNWQRE